MMVADVRSATAYTCRPCPCKKPDGGHNRASSFMHGDSETVARADDRLVRPQTFILAGYETTSVALTYAIFGIASYPEVERKLLAEVDAFW